MGLGRFWRSLYGYHTRTHGHFFHFSSFFPAINEPDFTGSFGRFTMLPSVLDLAIRVLLQNVEVSPPSFKSLMLGVVSISPARRCTSGTNLFSPSVSDLFFSIGLFFFPSLTAKQQQNRDSDGLHLPAYLRHVHIYLFGMMLIHVWGRFLIIILSHGFKVSRFRERGGVGLEAWLGGLSLISGQAKLG